MKHTCKTLPAYLALFLFIFLAKTSLAQYPGMAAFRAQQNRQFINQQMQMQMQMMNWRQSAGKGDTYMVTFKDSSVKKVVSWMYTDTILHKNFLVSVDKKFPKSDSAHRSQKIYSDQTLHIAIIPDFQSAHEIYGTPTDSCWTFKVISGAINVYSKYPRIAGSDFSSSSIIALQLNDGPMVKYGAEALKQMTAGDPEALENIEKKNYYKAIKKYNRDAEKAKK